MSFYEVVTIYLRYALRRPWAYGLFVGSAILAAIAANLLPLGYKWLFDVLQSGGKESFYRPLAGIIGILFAESLFTQLGFTFNIRVYRSVTTDLTVDAIANLQNQDYSYHTAKSSGKLIATVNRCDRSIITLVDSFNFRLLRAVFDFGQPIVIMAFFSLRIAAALLALFLVFLPVVRILLRQNVNLREATFESESQLTGVIVDNLVNFETVKAFAKEKVEQHRLRQAFVPLNRSSIRYLDYFRVMDTSLFFFYLSLILVGLWMGLAEYQAGRLGLSALIALLGYLFAYPAKVNEFFYNLRDIAKSMADFVSFFELIRLEPTIRDAARPAELPEPTGRIAFRNLSFSYGDSKTVRNINLEIEPGEDIALVGPSGAGKSTVAKLLLRYYDPQEGAILVDGTDIRSLRQERLREIIGIVPQDPIMFNASILYNVAYALPQPDRKRVEEACRMAQIHDFVTHLPEGYDTVVGERGIRLSGGQRQRLAIARAILKDPKFLIFDEATSALDSESEQLIHRAFAEVSREKTTLVVAHRLSTIVNCDRIFVLDDGKLIQTGTHARLIAEEGMYKKLWEIQSGGFLNPHALTAT